MEHYRVMVLSSATRTRVLVTHGSDEVLRAIFPPPSQIRHERAVPVFLEGLSQILDTSLHVVLCVDVRQAGFFLGLTDEMGVGERSLYYRVEVVPQNVRRRRGRRIRGVGDFADVRQLQLRLVIDRSEP